LPLREHLGTYLFTGCFHLAVAAQKRVRNPTFARSVVMMKRSILSLGVAAALMCSIGLASAQDKASQKFIKEAIEGNLAEVQMGQLAQEKAQSADVKSFGQMLVQDHGQANQQLTSVAGNMGVTPPSEPNRKQKADHARMTKMSGAKFDQAFAKHMVADHKKDIRDYDKQSKKNDAAGQYAQQTLPTLRKHLETSQSLGKAR
jgi:putative membrane protein